MWKNKISCTRINKYARNAIHKLRVLKLNWILSKYLHEMKISCAKNSQVNLIIKYPVHSWQIKKLNENYFLVFPAETY